MVKALLLLSHAVVLYLLSIVQFFASLIGWLAVLFTGRYPRNLFEVVAGVLRRQTRVNAWFLGLTACRPA